MFQFGGNCYIALVQKPLTGKQTMMGRSENKTLSEAEGPPEGDYAIATLNCLDLSIPS